MVSGFYIKHPGLTLEITLEEVDRLHIHEETIPTVLSTLAKKIKDDTCFIHPIIADKKTLVVLDGMHRVAAVKRLGYTFIPVCLVDYSNPHIIVGSWYRLVIGIVNLKEIIDILSALNLKVEACSFDKARQIVEARKAVTAVYSQSKCYAVLRTSRDIKAIYDIIKKIELKLQSTGYSINYDTETGAIEQASSANDVAALVTPPVTKSEIIQGALTNEVFTQKTTRHVIPARPMFLNIPNKWLRGAPASLSTKRKQMKDLLSRKKLSYLPSGQVIDRRYEEELYVFS